MKIAGSPQVRNGTAVTQGVVMLEKLGGFNLFHIYVGQCAKRIFLIGAASNLHSKISRNLLSEIQNQNERVLD